MKELTVTQYAALTNKTRKTIHNKIKSGEICKEPGVSARVIGEGQGSVYIISISSKSPLYKQIK